jgi:hypothetical protein
MTLWLELLLLAIASMFWPTLIVIVVLALHSVQPVRILAGFLAGGLLTTIVLGTMLVFTLEGSSVFSGSSHSTSAAVDISMGLLSLLAAYVIHRGGKDPEQAEEPVAEEKPKKPSMAQRVVKSGGLTAFGAGVVLNIVPGTFPIVALKDIADADASHSAKVLAIIAFYVIMFAFIEVPLIAFLFAPERTTTTATNMNAWMGRNGRRIAVYAIAAVGVYLVVGGVVELFQ